MQIEEVKVEAVTNFIYLFFWQILFLGAPKSLQMVTAAMTLKHACSLEESFDKPRQDVPKQRHHFIDKGLFGESYGFYSCHAWMELDHKESWVWKTDAFEVWCWRRFLRVPWTSRRSNQSILKEINFEYLLEGLLLKLTLQYFVHLMRRANLLEKTRCWER